jgi:hypothetical protein
LSESVNAESVNSGWGTRKLGCMTQHVEAEARIVTAHAVIEPDLREQLAELARENDRSVASEIRRALRAHIERELNHGMTEGENP